MGPSEIQCYRMSDRTTVQLGLIHEVSRLLSDAEIPHWLFGGWSVDFHAGSVTREHGDVEFFIWEHDGPRAAAPMRAAGYELVDHPHPEEASIWRKHGEIVELYFMVLDARGDTVGRGRWAEWPIPADSLGTESKDLNGVQCPVVSIECILAIKEGYARYTGIPLREKDQVDIIALRDAMDE